MSPNQRGWGEDAFIGRPCNPLDPHSHPKLTWLREVEGGLPKRAAHATSMTHMVTSPNKSSQKSEKGLRRQAFASCHITLQWWCDRNQMCWGMRIVVVMKKRRRSLTMHVKKVNYLAMFGHHVTDNKAPISDWFCKICHSSLNTRPICTILSAFERREHLQDISPFRNAKIPFSGLGRTYNAYFKGSICLNHGLQSSGTYEVL